MKNEHTNVPTPLTAEQTAMVSGGVYAPAGIVRTGCQTCTSGLPIAFQAIADVVNPAPMVQAIG